ncbi:hypothetical protein IL306_012677 [Fusarium sp. DS 682]|nr:hypothetical protein IL306_012677 [Fusarium sp. DS 682]
MSNQQKRPASDDPQPQRPAKRGRQAKMTPHEKALVHARWLTQEHPLVSTIETVDFARDMSETLTGDWTSSDEETVNDWWDTSDVKLSSRDLKGNHHSPLRILWRTSIRLLDVTPVHMISPLNRLRYQPMGKKDVSEIYSKRFCTELTSLMVHPCFEEESDDLVQVLQYAVICRIDERKFWPFNEHHDTKCPALKFLFEKLKACGESGAPDPIHRMHASARARALENRTKPSSWSDFLYHLGDIVSKDESQRPSNDDKYRHDMGWPVLPLTLRDLKAIVKAIDITRFRKREWRYSVAEAFSAWKEVNKVNKNGEGAPESKQLSDFYEITTKDVRRRMILSEKARAADTSSEYDSDEDNLEDLEEDVAPLTDRLNNDDDMDEEDDVENTDDGNEPPADTPADTRSSPAIEHQDEGDDDMGYTFDDEINADDGSSIGSTIGSQVASTASLPSKTSSEAILNIAASPKPPSVHDTLMYKCLEQKFRTMQQDMASLNDRFNYLYKEDDNKQKEIEFLRGEIDRLSGKSQQDRENIQMLTDEKLEALDQLEDEQRARRSLEKKVNELETLVRPSKRIAALSPYSLLSDTQSRLSDYPIDLVGEQDGQ